MVTLKKIKKNQKKICYKIPPFVTKCYNVTLLHVTLGLKSPYYMLCMTSVTTALLLRYTSVTTALLLRYTSVTTALLLRYTSVTTALLQFWGSFGFRSVVTWGSV